VIKLGFNDHLSRDEVVDLMIHALWQAADEDSATGGPDLIRGIYPVVATITADGFQRLADEELQQRSRQLLQRLEATS
jgi:proteasome beta subunit